MKKITTSAAIGTGAIVEEAWQEVGASLFVADWYLPKPLPEPARNGINRPVIRIASVQQPPERLRGEIRAVTPPGIISARLTARPDFFCRRR
jgi:hypothetical protein